MSCTHDSLCSDGWLRGKCSSCGTYGYWSKGRRVRPQDALWVRAYPDGRLLVRPATASLDDGFEDNRDSRIEERV